MARRYASLAEYLERTGARQEDVARRLKISQGHLSKIATGKVRPGFDLAMRIVREIGVPVESLESGGAQ
jgi:transcriptional regulator with XRE-family HTH domain